MNRIQVSLHSYSLKVTSPDIFPTDPGQVGEIYLIKGPGERLYLLGGLDKALACIKQKRESVTALVSADVVETNEDVTNLPEGMARGATTIADLLRICEAENRASFEQRGVEIVADYLAVQAQERLAAERRQPV